MDPNPKYPAQRLPGQEHIPLFPKGFIVIRYVQLALGVIALGLTAYLLAVTISYPGDSLMIFTGVVNLIVCVYYIVAALGPKSLYNYWAVLALDIFMLIFWLVSFAVLAAEAALVFTYINEEDEYSYCDSYDDSGYCDGDAYYSDVSSKEVIYAGCMAGAAGLGGLLFILYIASLAIHSVALHRHRAAGLHCTPVGSGSANGTGYGAAQQPAMAGGPMMMNPGFEKNGPNSVVTPAYASGMPPYVVQHQQMQQQNAAGYSMHSMTPPPQQQVAPQMYNGVPLQQPQPFYPPPVQTTPSPGPTLNHHQQHAEPSYSDGSMMASPPSGVQHHVEPSYSDGSGTMAAPPPPGVQQHVEPSYSEGTMGMASPPPGVHQLSATPAHQGPYQMAPQ